MLRYIHLRQSYTGTLKKHGVDQRFRSHPKNKSLERNLPPDSIYQETIVFFNQILAQTRTSKNKIYSIHEPDVLCISKGKKHKKYEFGNKVAIVKTQNTGVIVGAMGFRNEFDGHTLLSALEQVSKFIGQEPEP